MLAKDVRHERAGAVATITWSNPERFNAFTIGMWRSLASTVRELDADPAVRVIVLQGNGERAFCAGADLTDADYGRTADAASEMNAAGEDAMVALNQSAKPVIAKIRGVCMGGGLALASNCDLRICATDARFRMPAARLGLGYYFGGIQRFVAQIGPQSTFDMFATARTFDGNEALRLGFVARVAQPQELDALVSDYAALVGEQAPLSLRALKLAISACMTAPPPHELRKAEVAARACMDSADLAEGMAAFKDKRKPRFEGR